MPSSVPFTLTARWILPVSSSPLPRGIVTIRGNSIEDVSSQGERTADLDLGNVAIIPGLVNAHTHLDLSGAKDAMPPTDPDHFTDWLRAVIAYRRTRSPEEIQADIHSGLMESLRFGTTLVGDIASGGDSWELLSKAPLRAVVFRELIGLSEERSVSARNAAMEWYRNHPATDTCSPALSPHSPYSARHTLLIDARAEEIRAIHLAESPGEMELIGSRSGPFMDFLRELGAWDESGIVPELDSIIRGNRSAKRSLFVHANYLPLQSIDGFTPNMSVVYCPRTHAAFSHPPHLFREFLARGARVCLGTDSLASNPDLDVLAEARFVHQRYPDFPGEHLLRMATLAGADALGQGDLSGSLTPGKSADLVVVPLPDCDGDPYELLLTEHAGVRRVMFRGKWLEA